MRVAGSEAEVASRLRAAGPVVWIRVGRLLDGSGEAPLPGAHVVWDAARVLHAGADPPPAALAAAAGGAPQAGLDGWTLLPGLLDAHVHLFLDGAPVDRHERRRLLREPAAQASARAAARLPRLSRLGIAAVRDAGDPHGVALRLRAAPRSPGVPSIASAGPALFREGRYGAFLGRSVEATGGAAAAVAERARARVDAIKIVVSGVIDFPHGRVPGPPQFGGAEVGEIVRLARASGLDVMAHASGAAAVGCAIEGGVRTLEHGFFVAADQLAAMRDRRIAWVPTLSPVEVQLERAAEIGWDARTVENLRRITEGHREAIRRAAALGVEILAGSDAGSMGVPHGVGLLRELERLEKAGLPARAVLRAATGACAGALRFRDPVGLLRPGLPPRMILTRHDPLASVANLHRPRLVLFDGGILESDLVPDEAGL